MNSITRSLNIVTILTKNKDRKQIFLSIENLFSIFFFVKIATMFKLQVILFIIKI